MAVFFMKGGLNDGPLRLDDLEHIQSAIQERQKTASQS